MNLNQGLRRLQSPVMLSMKMKNYLKSRWIHGLLILAVFGFSTLFIWKKELLISRLRNYRARGQEQAQIEREIEVHTRAALLKPFSLKSFSDEKKIPIRSLPLEILSLVGQGFTAQVSRLQCSDCKTVQSTFTNLKNLNSVLSKQAAYVFEMKAEFRAPCGANSLDFLQIDSSYHLSPLAPQTRMFMSPLRMSPLGPKAIGPVSKPIWVQLGGFRGRKLNERDLLNEKFVAQWSSLESDQKCRIHGIFIPITPPLFYQLKGMVR